MDQTKPAPKPKMGRPRKSLEGGQSYTIYLPKALIEKLRLLGKKDGISHWIAKQIQDAELPNEIMGNKE